MASEIIPWIEQLHYVDQIKMFGSPLSYYFGDWLFGIILEGQAQENKARESMVTCKECNMTF